MSSWTFVPVEEIHSNYTLTGNLAVFSLFRFQTLEIHLIQHLAPQPGKTELSICEQPFHNRLRAHSNSAEGRQGFMWFTIPVLRPFTGATQGVSKFI